MVMSMTGYGRGLAEEQDVKFIAEIKTLNHRYLDINVRLPRNVIFVEDDVRNMVQANLSRGRVEVYITNIANKDNDSVDVQLNQSLLASYVSCFESLGKIYDIEKDLSLSTIMTIPDLFIMVEKDQDEEEIRKLVMKAVKEAIDRLKEMRTHEGDKLKQDIMERAEIIANMVKTIEYRSPIVVEEYRHKLKDRLTELVKSAELDENRFNVEVVYFADRSNITEEIVRLKSHIEQLEQNLQKGGSMGRKLDFLVQEMNREANTIGSKASDLTIINLVIDIKSEIEKIREQIQNIE